MLYIADAARAYQYRRRCPAFASRETHCTRRRMGGSIEPLEPPLATGLVGLSTEEEEEEGEEEGEEEEEDGEIGVLAVFRVSL